MKTLKAELTKSQKEFEKQNSEILKVNSSLLIAEIELNGNQIKLIELAKNIDVLKEQSDEAKSIISEMKKESLRANQRIESLQEVLSSKKINV